MWYTELYVKKTKRGDCMRHTQPPKDSDQNKDTFDRAFFGNPFIMFFIILGIIVGSLLYNWLF